MAYFGVTIMDIKEIIRRLNAGQTITHISDALDCDRKTVRKYVSIAKDMQFNLSDRAEFLKSLPKVIPELRGRPSYKQSLLEPYLEELKGLINNNQESLKPKSAFEVICQRHALTDKVSYSSFKRFAKTHKLELNPSYSTCRIETKPGFQVQIDYCKVGTLFDPLAKRQRAVYAFIGTLSHSRHKYVEFVFSQNQQSFVESHIKMFSFFGGVVMIVVLDNLKSGVIKPDLYNPRMNRAYADMAAYYGCFLDPCRVARPKDKAKVERDVQTVREQFKKAKVLNPNMTLAESNGYIKDWLINEYGMKKHGTTNLKPYLIFKENEQPKLLKLPVEPYEVALWKEAKVHPDHYIQVNKKAYSIPTAYIGKKVLAKVKHNLIQVYYNEQLIKQHPITTAYRQTDYTDFPENFRIGVDEGYPTHLYDESLKISVNFAKLVKHILAPHAYNNLRRVQGIMSLAKSCPPELIDKVSLIALEEHRDVHPKLFKTIIAKLQEQLMEENNQIPISEETNSFLRDIEYFQTNT